MMYAQRRDQYAYYTVVSKSAERAVPGCVAATRASPPCHLDRLCCVCPAADPLLCGGVSDCAHCGGGPADQGGGAGPARDLRCEAAAVSGGRGQGGTTDDCALHCGVHHQPTRGLNQNACAAGTQRKEFDFVGLCVQLLLEEIMMVIMYSFADMCAPRRPPLPPSAAPRADPMSARHPAAADC